MINVTDADRKAAVEIMADRWNRPTRGNVLAGNCDHYIPVQVCARHREAAEARARLEGMEIMREAAKDALAAVQTPHKQVLWDVNAALNSINAEAAILEAHTRAKAMDNAGDGGAV